MFCNLLNFWTLLSNIKKANDVDEYYENHKYEVTLGLVLFKINKYFDYFTVNLKIPGSTVVPRRRHFRELPFWITFTQVWQVRIPIASSQGCGRF